MATVPAKKQKLNKADFQFISKKDETLTKRPGDINGIQFRIKDLHNCIVYLLDHTAQITIDKCTNTKFFIGPVKSSIFVRDCENCEVTVACSQFRCRDLNNSTVNLFVANEPCIESSTNLKFAPYNLAYPLLDKHAIEAEYPDTEINKWDLIFDFTKKESGELNYSFVDPKDWKIFKNDLFDRVHQEHVVAFAYPVRYGGTIPDDAYFGEEKNVDGGGMMAFDIKTSADQAQIYAENQNKLEEKAKEDKKSQQTIAVGNISNIAAAAKHNRTSSTPQETVKIEFVENSPLDESQISLVQKEEEQKQYDVQEQEKMNTNYSMGYLKWHSEKFGIWSTFQNFFGATLRDKIVTAVFFNIGAAIGMFMMKNQWLPYVCDRIKFPQLVASAFEKK